METGVDQTTRQRQTENVLKMKAKYKKKVPIIITYLLFCKTTYNFVLPFPVSHWLLLSVEHTH